MDLRPLHTEENYRAAMRDISAFFDKEPEPGSAEGDRFEILLSLAEAWEAVTVHTPAVTAGN